MSGTTVWLDISLENPEEVDFDELKKEVKRVTSDPMADSETQEVAFGVEKLVCKFRTNEPEDLTQSIESLEAVSRVEMRIST